MKNFGLHLTLDGYFCNARALDDLDLITRSLTELPDRMGMKRLIPPYIVRAGANRKNDPGGYSGFVMIQESHISVHTFPSRRFVSIDVYSCRNFLTAPVLSYFRRVFGIRKVEKNIIIRGKEYPRADFA
ncbi:MAG: S-adenosylmethionine decarboxylase [bacterium]|nr:S-adenosylmethionine decarboxylase [bacterium]